MSFKIDLIFNQPQKFSKYKKVFERGILRKNKNSRKLFTQKLKLKESHYQYTKLNGKMANFFLEPVS